MKNLIFLPVITSEETKKESTKKNVLGKELSKSAKNELKIILAVISKFENRENLTWNQIWNESKPIRTSSKFALKGYNDLAQGTSKNFENRLAKTLGSTKEYGYNKGSLQALIFNIETQTDLKVKFSIPIDLTKNISPQVKAEGQTFSIKGSGKYRTSDVVVTPKFLERVAKIFNS